MQSLTVLDYLLHAGSENVVLYFRDNLYIIKTLKEFQYVDEDGKDCGANVRQKAKDISNLLGDAGRLREERRNRASMRDRMIRGRPSMEEEEEEFGQRSQAAPTRSSRTADRDEEELRRAIEASKKSHAEEQARQEEESDLQRAIRLSEEEEAKRNKAVEDSNASALFDDQAQMYVYPSEDCARAEFAGDLDRRLRMVRTTRFHFSILHRTQLVSNPSLPSNPSILCNLSSRPLILINSRHSRKRCRWDLLPYGRLWIQVLIQP